MSKKNVAVIAPAVEKSDIFDDDSEENDDDRKKGLDMGIFDDDSDEEDAGGAFGGNVGGDLDANKKMNYKLDADDMDEVESLDGVDFEDNDSDGVETNEVLKGKDEKQELLEWLEAQRLSEYFDTFVSNGIESIDILVCMNVNDLAKIGVKKIVHRRKLTAKLAAMKKSNSQKSQSPN